MPTKNAEAPDAGVDELDAGWDDDEREGESGEPDEADLDAGWEAAEAAKSPEEREREWRGLTPEERAERIARASARKERLRAKAAAKADRRKARASNAKAKQKQKSQRPRKERPPAEPSHRQASASVRDDSHPEQESGPRNRPRRNDPRVLVLLLTIVLVAGGVAFFLWKR